MSFPAGLMLASWGKLIMMITPTLVIIHYISNSVKLLTTICAAVGS